MSGNSVIIVKNATNLVIVKKIDQAASLVKKVNCNCKIVKSFQTNFAESINKFFVIEKLIDSL
jgi:hypothetical protein